MVCGSYWFRLASGTSQFGILIGLVVLQLVMAVINLLFVLPQIFVSAVLSLGCSKHCVPRCCAPPPSDRKRRPPSVAPPALAAGMPPSPSTHH